jgi:tRNA nucleotidyltransferase (CCA-adding enzyme)
MANGLAFSVGAERRTSHHMPDYIYLLENRLSPAQRSALRIIRDAARDAGMTVFLTGGAIRDLTSGQPVRDLDVSVQGNALELKKSLVHAGATLWGEHTSSRVLFFRFPGSVRMELASTRRETFPKPGKPVYEWAPIIDDLRRRDFTANAMAVSLNDGSYGLLMDPTNGVADIEMRTLRLVSNYGFLEDPVRLVRAARLTARLGWQMDERTRARFDAAREEGVASAISEWWRGYEVEEIGHEENPLEMLRAMEAQGWMKELFPAWTAAKADVQGLEEMHEVLTRLQMQGIYPDASTAAMELLTAKMSPKDLQALKKFFVRPGFVAEWERLDADATAFAHQLTSKEAAAPSAAWKLFMRSKPEAVLWLGLTGKGAAIQNKFKNFFNVWPEAKQKVPAALMLEMRITPELERYPELIENLFYQTLDGKLETEEQMRAFLEPYSPPAPPPPVTVRRPRAAKKAGEKKGEKRAAAKKAALLAEAVPELTGTAPVPGQVVQGGQATLPTNGGGAAEAAARAKTAVAGKGAASKTPPAKPPAAVKSVTAAKKVVPEGKAKPIDVKSPVQAAARLAGTRIGEVAATAGKKAAAPSRPTAKAVATPPKAAKRAAVAKAKPVAAKKATAKAPAKKTASKAKGKATPVKKATPGHRPAKKPTKVATKASAKPAAKGKATAAKKHPTKAAAKGKPAPKKKR